MSKAMKHEGLYIAIFAAGVILIAILGALAGRTPPHVIQLPGTSPKSPTSRPLPPPTDGDPNATDASGYTEKSCAAAGGTWNPCASACPDAPSSDVCIEMCVQRCEFPGE